MRMFKACVLLLCTIMLFGCPFNTPISVTEVSITNEGPITLQVGETEVLTVSVVPSNANEGTALTFTSSDTSVVTVKDNVITAVKAGNATITVSSENGKKDTISVVVTAPSSDEGNDDNTGGEDSGESETPVPEKNPTIALNATSVKLIEGGTATLTVTYTDIETANQKVTWVSSDTSIATVDSSGKITAVKAGNATITATTVYGAVSASCAITVTGEIAKAIRVTDVPTGWASYTGTKDLAGGSVTSPTKYGGNGGTVVTVSTRSDLQNYAKKGNYVIYVDGMIDMTDGKMPSKASESTSALDSWIASKSSVATSLATWKTYYAGGNTDSADESGAYKTNRQTLSNAWSSLITINVESNTTIIGLTDESGVKGGCFKISGKSNIVMRNLIIQDAYDPFPQIEKGDGFNANYDAIEISNGSKYIWIDHCTFRDTISKTDSDFDTVTLSDGAEKKYQVFDGLCDIKQASDFITVSYCKFMDHDKTQLIGHSSSYTADTNHQTITLHNNYYLNCGQRLPMVRFATIHIYNNYYDTDGTGRKNSYCIGLRENNKVYAENNYFGNVTPVSNSQGSYYFTGNYGYDNTGSAAWTPSSYYTYTPLSAADAKADVTENAGAGKLTVIK